MDIAARRPYHRTMALAALGGAALLRFRRRKKVELSFHNPAGSPAGFFVW
jgi:hypothetical protein